MVVANYFARIFYRNAINIGLPVIEAPSLVAETGDELEVNLIQGMVVNRTRQETYPFTSVPPVMLAILSAGGLVSFMKAHGGYEGIINHAQP